MTDKLLAAIDLGGTKIYTVIADSELNILSRVQLPSPAREDTDTLLSCLADSVHTALNRAGAVRRNLAGCGICVAGFFDSRNRLLLDSPNLPQIKNLPLEKELEKLLGVPVIAENDANAAALGEAHYGAGAGSRNMAFVTVSTGIGAGLVLDGRLYRGNRGFSGEIGHMAVKPDGPLCGCGRRGFLETVASVTAIARSAQELLTSGRKTALAEIKGKISATDVFAAAAAGDPPAREILDEAIYCLGIGLVNLVNLLDPEVLVVGGGVANAGEALFAPLRSILGKKAVTHIAKNVTLNKAALVLEAGVVGRLCLLRESCFRQ